MQPLFRSRRDRLDRPAAPRSRPAAARPAPAAARSAPTRIWSGLNMSAPTAAITCPSGPICGCPCCWTPLPSGSSGPASPPPTPWSSRATRKNCPPSGKRPPCVTRQWPLWASWTGSAPCSRCWTAAFSWAAWGWPWARRSPGRRSMPKSTASLWSSSPPAAGPGCRRGSSP